MRLARAASRSATAHRTARRVPLPRARAHPTPLPRARPAVAAHDPIGRVLQAHAVFTGSTPPVPEPAPASRPAPLRIAAPAAAVAAVGAAPATAVTVHRPMPKASAADIAALKEAIALAGRGKGEAASVRRDAIRDPTARALAEWAILRSGDPPESFWRYAAYIRENPAWPGIVLVRKRAEMRLWTEDYPPRTVLGFFTGQQPITALGRLALARALLAQGDRANAQKHVVRAWREAGFSENLEEEVLSTFSGLLSVRDEEARYRARIFADDISGAIRAAKRLPGPGYVALAKARSAVNRRARNAGALLGAVPRALRHDPAYVFTRAQWLRRTGHPIEAGRLLAVARVEKAGVDADDWWRECRTLVRELLDAGQHRLAYRVAAHAPLASRESLRVDKPFTAGWIALRYLHDPRTAERHFARIPKLTTHPTSLARADYWLGRTAEASGRRAEARRFYAAAAQHPAAYYGQLASAKLGQRAIPVRRPQPPSRAELARLRHLDLVRAVELLYATGNRELVVPFAGDLSRCGEVGTLTLIAETAAAHQDARGMMAIGRHALARGYGFDHFAFPAGALPSYRPLGPKADPSLVYAIARAESGFNPTVVSHANAFGLMQVTAPTGRTIARRLGIRFDRKRLKSDPLYNLQMGAAELADLIDTYDGNHVLAFVGYNAGRGRVRQWTERYGDPRDPRVDPVDWVERIPFTETRIYVQRVMENLQVYRSRFRSPGRLTIEADMRGASRG
ncbi:Soluble lytic murein transglycosylase precursor [Rhodovulum sp. PH10]|nr:Soluble lytic murein transglycosylase precursor [Rhodovulum sp. PH10]